MTTKTTIPRASAADRTYLSGTRIPRKTGEGSVCARQKSIIVLDNDRRNHTARMLITASDLGAMATLSIDRVKGFARVDLRLGRADQATALAGLAAMENAHARCVWFRWDREDSTAWLRAETLCTGGVAGATRTLIRQLQRVLSMDLFPELLREAHGSVDGFDSRKEVAA